ncbi:IucA/IucC family protein [Sphaerisporangium perillae]|uniref:IucA/IucC family protein n=1 Tax=Sphaerisporangium perillae TaxID=2935860 RepID=UPI00201014C9|nr:IucA/IucC family protein [Sphaerisporangium perillae]
MNGVVCDSAAFGLPTRITKGTPQDGPEDTRPGEAEVVWAGDAEEISAGHAKGGWAGDADEGPVGDADEAWAGHAEGVWAGVAEEASLAALLRCCVREVAAPRGQVWAAAPYLLLRLAGTLIRVPTSGGLALRFDGPAERLRHGSWHPLSVNRLVRLVEAELGGQSGSHPVTGTGLITKNDPGTASGPTTENGPIMNNGSIMNNDPTTNNGSAADNDPSTDNGSSTDNDPSGDNGLTAENDSAAENGSIVGHNEEFAGQVAASRAAMMVMLRERAVARPPEDPWLASEQALVFGHPFHPSPKARGGSGWARYAPEAHAAFPLRLLGVRDDLLVTGGDSLAIDGLGQAPPGYTLLPAHPWQLELLGAELAAPLADGRLVDLGYGPHPAIPTSSVRTVYEPAIGKCLKFSLDVRITNCLRKNAWYELASAVELSGRLEPVFADLSRRFPGTRWLPEPGYRSAALGTRLLEGLGVIVRSSPWEVTGPQVTPVLAGALAALRETTDVGAWPNGGAYPNSDTHRNGGAQPNNGTHPYGGAQPNNGTYGGAQPNNGTHPNSGAQPDGGARLNGMGHADGVPHASGGAFVGDVAAESLAGAVGALRRDPVRWWGAYVERVALPVFDAYFRHGVVLEPHLQNVLVGIGSEGMPVEAIFRDLEGTKLVAGRHDISGLPDPVTKATTYDATRGWTRVVYCIMVNHLPEIAATVAGSAAPHARDELLRELWADARARVARYAGEHARPLPLRDLLAGAPLPAKANLATRWARSADRHAGYVAVANPFAGVRR